jgi:DNA gyrase subunit A
MKAKYTSPRRTEIIGAAGEFRMEDVIPNEGCVITVSHLGFIKRTPVADYRSQKRGGKGVIGAETYEEDFVEHLFTASTHDYILFLTSIGQCHAKKVYDVPEGTRTSKGKSVSSFLRLSRGREDRRHALREGLRRRPLPRHGHQERRHQEELALRLRQRHPRRRPHRHQPRRGRHVIGTVLTTGTTSSSSSPTRASPSASANAIPRPARTLPRHRPRHRRRHRHALQARERLPRVIEVVDHDRQVPRRQRSRPRRRTRFEDYRLINRGGSGVWAIDLPEDGSDQPRRRAERADNDEIMLLTAKGQSVRCPVNTSARPTAAPRA